MKKAEYNAKYRAKKREEAKVRGRTLNEEFKDAVNKWTKFFNAK